MRTRNGTAGRAIISLPPSSAQSFSRSRSDQPKAAAAAGTMSVNVFSVMAHYLGDIHNI
jgi:hypothetical protein